MSETFKIDLFSKKNTKWKLVKKKSDILKIQNIIFFFLKKKSVYKISHIKKIDALGINSNNFYFNFEKKNYVLKKYDIQNINSLENIAELMSWLKKKKIPIQKPIKLSKKKYVLDKNNKKWRLLEFINGSTFSGTMSEFKNVTISIAKMSSVISKYPNKKKINSVYSDFSKDEFDAINFAQKNLHKLENFFNKKHVNLLKKNWQNLLDNWKHVKNLKINSGSIQPIHNDLHPHNLIIKHDKLNGILDWESCQNMPIGISLAYAGLKICKQVLIKNKLKNPRKIGCEYKKIIKKYSLLDKKVINNFYDLSLIEVIKRICLILKSAIINKDKRWNKILPIQLAHLNEARELFFQE